MATDVEINFNYEELLPAEDCVLHKEHSPRLLGCVGWMVFPYVLQRLAKIEPVDIDETAVPMCPTGWMNVAIALQDLLKNDGRFQSSNTYSGRERHYAWKAYDAYRSASEKERTAQ